MMQMTITDPEWTREAMYAGWRDEESIEVADLAADSQYAWLILNTRARLAEQGLRGWTFHDGAFAGPAANRSNICDAMLALITESVDYVVEHLDEIRKDAAEQG